MAIRGKRKEAGPKPRTVPRRALKRCPEGHRQAADWRPGERCNRCEWDRRERERGQDAVAERERWNRELGPPPDVIRIPTGDGKVMTFGTGLARRRSRR